jgi:hypothetical protein
MTEQSQPDCPPRKLVAVGCSSSKHTTDGEIRAQERYKGGYWTNKSDYGDTVGDEWGIISAQYGLLRPDDKIPYYERTVDDLKGVPVHSDQRLPNGDSVETMLDQWALNVYQGIAQWLAANSNSVFPRDVQLEVLLGKNYLNPLRERGVFTRLNIPGTLDIRFPFQQDIDYSDGGGIGKQRSWMVDQIEEAAPIAD